MHHNAIIELKITNVNLLFFIWRMRLTLKYLIFTSISGIIFVKILAKLNHFPCRFSKNYTIKKRGGIMYKPIDKLQYSFLEFKQPMVLHMNPNNHRIKMADCIFYD